jgi:hypothetical protein
MDGEDRGIGIMNKMWKRVLKGLLISVLTGHSCKVSLWAANMGLVPRVCETIA